jgi:3-isopropylmalate/(R)-2-methylmalate dehydratase large subunit
VKFSAVAIERGEAWRFAEVSTVPAADGCPYDGPMSQRTLFDKVWDEHVVDALAPGIDLLHIDRHLMHDLGGGDAIAGVLRRGLPVRNPELTFATPDHVIETRPGRTGGIASWADDLVQRLREQTALAGVRLYDVGQDGNGIVHVVGPELGISLPGTTIVCGDSHTSTHGALGAIAFGIGATEVEHVLATQTLPQRRPRTMRAEFTGVVPAGVGAKDMILALIGRIGTAGGTGHALEYTGPAVRALDMEGRMTMSNLTIESGAKVGMIAPDETTFAWLRGRPHAPAGARWDEAVAYWRGLASDADATYDAQVTIDCSALAPHITWGTSPEQVIRVDAAIPDPAAAPDAMRRKAWAEALAYMGLQAGRPIAGTRIDRVFIGSCTNSRLPDLRRAAAVVQGKRVAGHVEAWVVPGSERVKREAEAEGLHEIFLAAGLQWREPGCSLCVGANGELVGSGQRCVSTSNRNFVGRQGPGARTHLASPEMAAAAAIAGAIVDVRSW